MYRRKRTARSHRGLVLLAVLAAAVMVLAAAVLVYLKYWDKDFQPPDDSQNDLPMVELSEPDTTEEGAYNEKTFVFDAGSGAVSGTGRLRR